jgi:2-polyprenyl-3-methyl-5-hydroxy-6-metoxy-1,4-benzoquinol methylase
VAGPVGEGFLMERRMEQMKAVESFNNKVKKGLYLIEEVPCLCGSNHSFKIASHDRYGLWSPVVLCKRCGLIYANPRLTKESYQTFYSSDEYRGIYEEDGDYLEAARHRYDNGFGRDIFENVSTFMDERKLSTVLEFGCGGGWNLIHFLNSGYEVRGYDYSPSLIELGKSKGLNLNVGSFDELMGRYDLIILNHALEHFTDLFASIKKLCSHLNPNGILYIAVPNMDHFFMGQLQNAHIYYFTPRTFKHYMALNGLKMIQFGSAQQIHMYGIFEASYASIQCDFSLGKEFSMMKRKIQYHRFRSSVGSILERAGFGTLGLKFYHLLSPKSSHPSLPLKEGLVSK